MNTTSTQQRDQRDQRRTAPAPEPKHVRLPDGWKHLSPDELEVARSLRVQEIELNKRLRALQTERNRARSRLEEECGQAIREVDDARRPIKTQIRMMIWRAQKAYILASTLERPETKAVLAALEDYGHADLRMGKIDYLLSKRFGLGIGRVNSILRSLCDGGKVELVTDPDSHVQRYRLTEVGSGR